MQNLSPSGSVCWDERLWLTYNTAKPSEPKLDEERVGACEDFILKIIQVQDFTYEKAELVARVFNEGFKLQEVEAALNRLTSKSLLRYSEVTGGYSLPNQPP